MGRPWSVKLAWHPCSNTYVLQQQRGTHQEGLYHSLFGNAPRITWYEVPTEDFTFATHKPIRMAIAATNQQVPIQTLWKPRSILAERADDSSDQDWRSHCQVATDTAVHAKR